MVYDSVRRQTVLFSGNTDSTGQAHPTDTWTYASTLTPPTLTWVGTTIDWHSPANWTPTAVPDATTDVVINAGANNPVITAPAACRSVTVFATRLLRINAPAFLEVHGNTSVLGQVTGTGLLRVTGGSSPVDLRGRFANVEIDQVAGANLIAGSTLSGTLTVTQGVCTVGSGCQAAALTVSSRGTLEVGAANSQSPVVTGSLSVLANHVGRGQLRNLSTAVPIVVRGTTHTISGDTSGLLRFEASANTRLSVDGVVGGETSIITIPGVEFVVDGVGRQGRFGSTIVSPSSLGSQRGDIVFENVQCADVILSWVTVWIRGVMGCAKMDLQTNSTLRGGTADVLEAEILWLRSSFCREDAPGQILIQRNIAIASTSTFRPVRSVIRFENPLTNPIVVSAEGDTTHLGAVIMANGVRTEFCDTAMTGFRPYLDRLDVGTGCVATVIDWHALSVNVEASSAFDMKATYVSTPPALLGPMVVDGTATIDTHISVGGSFSGMIYRGDVTVGTGGVFNARPVVGTLDTELTVAHDLVLRSGGQLNLLSGARLVVTPTGKLTLDGTQAAPAVIAGSNSAMQLDGEISARSFRISGMDINGVRIVSGARFGNPAADRNFQGGHFTGGQPGGVLLAVERSTPTTLWDLDFDDTGGASVNVRTLAGSTIDMVDSRGNLAGEAFDHDPGDRVVWRSNATAIEQLMARPGVMRNVVSFSSTREETLAFRVLRAPSVGLAPMPAIGPSTYTAIDDGLLAGIRHDYSVERQRLSPFAAEWQPVAAPPAWAIPHSATEGNTRFVGPNGFATIAAALVGAPAGSIVFVEPGSYPGFTVAQPVHIVGDGAVDIVGPVLVNNIAGASEVILDGLTLASTSSLTVQDVAVPVIVHGVTVRAGALGLSATRCPKVALQRVSHADRSQFTTSTVHAWNCDLGRVELVAATRFVHASTTTTAIVPDATSSAPSRTGPTAMLDVPTAWPSNGLQTLTVQSGGPGHFFGINVLLSGPNDYLDLSSFLPFDMVLLVSLGNLIVLPGGVLDASGRSSFALPGPSGSSAAGYALQFQLFTLDPVALQGRCAELRQLIMLR